MFKIVSQLDPSGYFIAEAHADRDPEDPEKYLLPFGCVDAQPPEIPAGKRARYVDGAFVLEDIPLPPPPPEEPPPTPEQIQAQITNAVQARLDAFAREREYDSMASLVTYVDDPNPVFAAEGARGKLLRSQTWAMMKQIRAEVLAGTRPMPASIADIEADLPSLIWPN